MNVFTWNVLLALAWMAMTGTVTPGNLVLGWIIGFLALMFTRRVPGLPHYTRRGTAIVALLAYTLMEIVLANLRVTRDLIWPKNIRPALISFETRAEGDLELTLLAALVTITPGTTVVDVSADERRFLVHYTNLPTGGPDAARAEIRDGFERRVLEVLR
ncbi:MAG: Na+/H+ antiporter subunit E [Chloroflexi bacterium]|nr:Na+/H+ antiporter subunit E [Chloroflexota bacterium]